MSQCRRWVLVPLSVVLAFACSEAGPNSGYDSTAFGNTNTTDGLATPAIDGTNALGMSSAGAANAGVVQAGVAGNSPSGNLAGANAAAPSSAGATSTAPGTGGTVNATLGAAGTSPGPANAAGASTALSMAGSSIGGSGMVGGDMTVGGMSAGGTGGALVGIAGAPTGVAGAAPATMMPINGVEYFEQQCSVCHGATGEGAAGLGPEIQHPPRDFATWVVRNGRTHPDFPGAMVAYGSEELSDAWLTEIFDYLDTPPQPTTGEGLYLDYCANCHGTDGTGGVTARQILFHQDQVRDLMRGGHGGMDYGNRSNYMPVFGANQISDAEVTLIADHVATL